MLPEGKGASQTGNIHLPGKRETTIEIKGRTIGKGSKVRLNLSASHADVFDIFLDRKIATVEGIYSDYEKRLYVAVSLDDDPGREMCQEFGQERNFFFFPEELEVAEKNE